MLKRLAVFPFLFILYIVLSPLLNNLDQLDTGQVLRPLVVLACLALLAMAALRARLKDAHYAGWLVFLALAFFFVFGHLDRVLAEQLPALPGWTPGLLLAAWGGLLGLLGVRNVWLRLGGAALITPLANLSVTAALLGQLVTHAGAIRLSWLQPDPSEQAVASEGLLPEPEISLDGLPETGDPLPLDCTGAASSARLPDIYYILLDAYGREDVLAGLYGVDNGPFLAFLEEKGFYIAGQSHTNFIQTVLSVPASLNFNYLSPEPEGVNGAAYFTHLISENLLFKTLEGCGYQTVVLKSGFYFTNHIDADLTLSSGSKFSEFEDLLLAGTPADLLAGGLYSRTPELSYPAHRRRVLYAFDQLQQLPRLPGPQLVFAHIVSPHPPFVFDAQGRAIEPDRAYSIEDGDEFRGAWDEYRRGYAGQMEFVNRILAKTIRLILARSSTPPVIVIQGDHGPGGFLDWDSPENTCLWERTSILNAYYLPGVDTGQLSPSLSPVNTFRVILNAYFDAGLELLPDRTFYTSHLLPRQVTEITERRESRENCP